MDTEKLLQELVHPAKTKMLLVVLTFPIRPEFQQLIQTHMNFQ